MKHNPTYFQPVQKATRTRNVFGKRSYYFFLCYLVLSSLLFSPTIRAQVATGSTFGIGNLTLIVAAASANNTTASLVEINKTSTSQSAIQTINIPGANLPGNGTNGFRVSGSATSTLYAGNTNDGSLFTLTGCISADAASNANTLTNRAVLSVNNAGQVNIATTYTGTSGQQARAASSLNNTTWFIGDQGGFYSNTTSSPSPTGNYRGVKSFSGSVYAFQASTASPPVGIMSAATGGTFTGLTGLANGAASRQDFYLISSGSNGSTFDILYILDATSATAGTIFKFSLVSGTWTANGSYSTTVGGFGMCAEKGTGTTANIFITTGTGATTANSVRRITDDNGYNSTISVTTTSTLYTAAAGTIVKGINFAPIGACTNLSALSYTNASPSPYCTGTAITANNATVTGTTPVTYAISPNINTNTGLAFNTSTGAITGTPTTASASTVYTITATNSCPSTTTTTVTVEVNAPPTALSYSTATASYCNGTLISDNTPTFTGSAATSYAINPDITTNTGLTFNTTTGVISGTATTNSPATTYTVTVTNACGNTTTTISVAVLAPPTALSYTTGTASYCQGTAITNNTPSFTGAAATSYAISPDLNTNTGLTFNTTTGNISGTPTTVSASTIYTVTLTNACGNTTTTIDVTVNGQSTTATLSGTTTITSGNSTNLQVDITGGSSPYTVVLTDGTTPFTVTGYNSNDNISVSPTVTTTYSLVSVTSANGCLGIGNTGTAIITVNPAVGSPVINSALTAAATYGTLIVTTYIITATNSPTSYSATGLPTGLSVNTSTGEITGTPTAVPGNYNVTISATNGSGTGSDVLVYTISQKPLTVTGATGDNKEYNQTTAATISGSTLVGVIAADNGNVTISNTGTFASATVANGILITSTQTLGGSAASNYSLTVPTGLTGNITPKPLTVTGASVTPKLYDGNTTATVTGATLNGVVAPDAVTINNAGTGTYATVGAANGIAVATAFSLTGADAGNYSITQPSLTGNITTVVLTVAGITASNKVYDGFTTVTLNTGSAAYVGLVNSESFSVTGTITGTFADKNVGTGKTVTIAGVAAPSTNYTVTQPTTTANITLAPLTITGAAVTTKVFDNNTNATITGTLSGIISPDVVTLVGTGTFATSAVGTGIAVTANCSTSGADGGNYEINPQPSGLTGTITAAPVTLAQWTYETQQTPVATPAANTGTGTSQLVGSMSGANYATGMTGTGCGAQTSATFAWANVSAPGSTNESSGVQYNTSTAGYQDIKATWDQRFSNTAPNTVRLQYTSDGTTWNNFDMNSGNTTICSGSAFNSGRFEFGGSGDQYRRISVDLTSITAINNNANFGIRIVAAHYQTTGEFRQANNPSNVATAGTWRFDNVKFEGIPGTPPSTPTVNLSVSTNTGSETAATIVTVEATASAAVSSNQTVSLVVTGTGISAGDYTLSSVTITIPTGMTTGTVTFTVVDDMDAEATETAILTINNPSSGIQLGSQTAQNIVITDNDSPPSPTVALSVNANIGEETNSTVIVITATASAPSATAQTVTLSITGTNITPSDYFLSSATITIPAGQTSGTVSLTISDDGIQESDETAILTIGSPSSGLVLGSPTVQNILIKNNSCTFMRKTGSIVSANGSEIPAFDPVSKRLYVVAGPIVEFFDVANNGSLTLGGTIAPGFTPPSNRTILPNSVAVKNGLLAVAYAVVNTTTSAQDTGRVSIYTAATGAHIKSVNVGFLPDMVTFTPDGSKVLTANEGEPNSYGQGTSFDPEGSVSIIDISTGAANATVQQASFTSYNGQETALRSQGIRIYGPGANASMDFEPEYIAFSNDGSIGYVSLQENNAIAVLDIATATFTTILPLGLKNHNVGSNGFDASDQDVAPNRINIQNWPVSGMYQPDAIASFTIDGQTYLISANEGDSRAYTGYSEEIRVGAAGYVLDPTIFPNAATLKLPANLGRLQLTNATGDTDGDGDFDRIDALGARSFSIWNTSGTLVFDSGNQLESITALKSPNLFNSDGTSASFDGRSDNKGPEPEGVAIGVIEGKTYAFIGIERSGDVMIYDVSNPVSPIFIQYINTPEDLAVEGLIFIKDTDSPSGIPMLITAAEVSKTVTIYEIGTSIVTNSADAGTGTLREAIGCIIDGGTVIYDQPTTVSSVLINPLTINKNLTLQGLSETQKPEITVDFTSMGTSAGIKIEGGNTVNIKNVDIKDINNTNMPANSVLDIQAGTVKVLGSTQIIKVN